MATPSRLHAMLWHTLALLSFVSCGQARDTVYTYGTDIHGVRRPLAVDRDPALYTGDFGDCLGGQSLFNITKFDAAYYADNMTIVLHLDGTSNIRNDSLMMHMSVHAYGEDRFDMTFDPCKLNIYSLCPLIAGQPITGWATIPVGPQQIGEIPDMAYTIPDFEGTARLQIFSNSSRTEVGCFQAVMRNGVTLSHPEAVAPVLGVFTVIAIAASFLSAAYGISITHMRMHHAHSLSVLLVFETFQYIFFSGAISVNWPSILVGWWSNFAWSAGQIYTSGMVPGLDAFSGINGNASQVGGAGSTTINNGGGLVTSIYGRALHAGIPAPLLGRADTDGSNPYDYTWAGHPVTPGMPAPGTWYGFAGTLSGLQIPAASAFLIGLIWFLVAIGLVILCLIMFKYALEALVRFRVVKQEQLKSFRENWLSFIRLAVSRAFVIGFFTMATLAIFQLSLNSTLGSTAVAAIVFITVVLGATSLVAVAIRARTRLGSFDFVSDRIVLHQTKIFKVWPLIIPARRSTLNERNVDTEAVKTFASIPFFRIRHVNNDPAYPTVHRDETFVQAFGWMTARYRRTRWWFLVYYLGYQFVRACFLGAGTTSPLAQVYGLLVFEIVAFIITLQLNPWEGSRNTALAVYMLSISKVLTTGLSIAFLPDMGLARIPATIIGVMIIVIQGLLVVGVMILVVLSAVSTWMSLTRNRPEIEPDWLDTIRVKYFRMMEEKAPDTWLSSSSEEDKKGKGKDTSVLDKSNAFAVNSVRRASKIQDEKLDDVGGLDVVHVPSATFDTTFIQGPSPSRRPNGTGSRKSSLRKGGSRGQRSSWSSRDFTQWDTLHEEPIQEEALGEEVPEIGSATHNAGGKSSRASSAPKSSSPVSAQAMNTTATPLRASSGNTLPRLDTRRSSLRTEMHGSAASKSSPSSSGRFSTPSLATRNKYASERRFSSPQPPTDLA